jgi:hypothetical protein
LDLLLKSCKHSVNRVRCEFGRGRAHVLPDRRRA